MIAAMIANAVARITCRVRGHKRGKRAEIIGAGQSGVNTGHMLFVCPRCQATWTRKVRA